MVVAVGSSPLTVTAVGRMVVPGNTQTHEIRIYNDPGGDGPATVVPGAVATVDTAAGTPGQFVYASLPIPIVLEANKAYAFLSFENGVDSWRKEYGSVTTTSNAVLTGYAYQIIPDSVSHAPDMGGTAVNHPFGPLDFTYTIGDIPGRPTIVIGSPYDVALPGLNMFGVSPFNGPTSGGDARVVSGTVNLEGGFPGPQPGTATYQWVLYGAAGPTLGPVFTSSIASGGLSTPFDTTTVPNGTYVFYPKFLDASSISLLNVIAQPATMIVTNGGSPVIAPPVQLPCAAPAPIGKWVSPKPDYVTYDGVPNPIHQTYPVPYTPIPGANNPASPFHSSPALLRDKNNWQAGIHPGPRQSEYNGSPQFVRTLSGGVYVEYFNPQAYNNTAGAYDAVVNQNFFSGTRLNATVSPFTTYVEHPTIGGEWYGCAINGQVFKIDRNGNTTTIVGPDRDRSVLTPDPRIPGLTEDQIPRIIVGTHPVGFEDMGGANDLCFDPRDHNILYVAAQLDHWIGKVNISAQSVEIYAGVPETSGYHDAANPLAATFNEPTSLIMAADGTMYVADRYNSAIRKITSSGTIGIAGAVTTLCGGSIGPTPPANEAVLTDASGSFAVSSITWNSGPQNGTVVMTTPIPNLQVGWTLWLSGAVNTGGSGDPNTGPTSGAQWIVSALTDNTHFTVVMGDTPFAKPMIGTLSGTMSFRSWNIDFYSRPGTVTFTGGQGWINFPNAIRFASNGNIVVLESGCFCLREISLGGGTLPAGSIRRVGCPDNMVQHQSTGWAFFDIDAAGTCGPRDDIVIAAWETDATPAHWISRIAFAPATIPGQTSYSEVFSTDGGWVTFASLWQVFYGFGHYPWAFAFSRLEGRMIGTGFANWQPTHAQIKQPSDPDANTLAINVIERGNSLMLKGTIAGFPYGARPSFRSLWGEFGNTFIGNRSGAPNTFEDMHVMFPTDAALAAYIQGGMGGVDPRPEITGNALRDLIYFIRRNTMQGSAGPTPVLPGANDPDTTPPIVLSLSAVRIDATTIRVQYTTNEPTIGLIGAGSATQTLSYLHYPMFSPIESAYATSHDQTVSVPSGMTPVHYVVVTKDRAGNVVHTVDATII